MSETLDHELAGYALWFKHITGHEPHPWQRRLGEDARCRHRLIRVPTGMGKTAGASLVWLFHRAIRNDPSWPRRLIYTVPAHVLTEPIEDVLRGWLERAGLAERVALHVLSAATRAEPWALVPDVLAVLIGTQDMVLSRALNRGHGTPRALWPAEMALLNHDALWVLDEVHLTDTGLTTSVQLAAFREQDRERAAWFRPSRCWCMGATLNPARLRSVDTAALIEPLSRRMTGIPSHERQGGAWEVQKNAERRADVRDPVEMAALAIERHAPATLTLCVVNRIEPGLVAFRELHRLVHARSGPDARLKIHMVHGQFRGAERRACFEKFLDRGATMPPGGCIVVSTPVIEASVNVSARVVITELAPWASLVQRAGRAGRYEGEHAQVIVIGPVPENERDAAPYDMESLAAADKVWRRLAQSWGDASMRALVRMEEQVRDRDPGLFAALHGPEPGQMLQRRDVDELFDTTADLSGVDLDVSCLVRSQPGDVWVAWRDLDDDSPEPERLERAVIGAVSRDELCPVPIHEARAWVEHIERGYVLDHVAGAWVRIEPSRLVSGAVMVMPASVGGYDCILGWDPSAATNARRSVMGVEVVAENPADKRSASMIHDDHGSLMARAIAAHGGDTARAVAALCDDLGIGSPHKGELMLAARWHDAGTVHPGRAGFRHELASTLALFEFLRRAAPEHDAMLGLHDRELVARAGMTPAELLPGERVASDDPLAGELVALSGAAFNRVAYLVCSHHGKVRCAWESSPADELAMQREPTLDRIHGITEGDELAGLVIEDATGTARPVPRLTLHLDAAALGLNPRYGASWVERVARLRASLGPFALAFLETVLRAADARASCPLPCSDIEDQT